MLSIHSLEAEQCKALRDDSECPKDLQTSFCRTMTLRLSLRYSKELFGRHQKVLLLSLNCVLVSN